MSNQFKVQTCNGNYEVIRTENGIAKEIIIGDKFPLSFQTAKIIAALLDALNNCNQQLSSWRHFDQWGTDDNKVFDYCQSLLTTTGISNTIK